MNRLFLPEKKVKQLNKVGIETVDDLLSFFPKRYRNYKKPIPVIQLPARIHAKEEAQLMKGEPLSTKTKVDVAIVGMLMDFHADYAKSVLRARLEDNSGKSISIVWFKQNYLHEKMHRNKEYIVCGEAYENSYVNGRGERITQLQIDNPLVFDENIEKYQRIIPAYKKIRGMSEEYLRGAIKAALIHSPEEFLDAKTMKEYGLIDIKKAYRDIHFPEDEMAFKQARKRILFNDMFVFQYQLEGMKQENQSRSTIEIKSFSKFLKLLEGLPFTLTDDQLGVIREISRNMRAKRRVNALVQGDVGCGKTIVAMGLLTILAENGYQGALVAPTTILAEQHYAEAQELLAPLGINVVRLTGNTKGAEKRKAKKMIADGQADVVVGTHAVIQKDVKFNKLGIQIVDEQHRFGVEQREILLGEHEPHGITMSATPIPRTLSMALYGSILDVYTIKTLPNGRKPVKTRHTLKATNTYNLILEEVNKGRQAYVVCPLVENSKSLDGVKSATEVYKEMQEYFASNKKINVGLVNGKMKKEEADAVIQEFASNKLQVLIATTVIEVGVNVPNATMIVIKNAERFGLAQLHQLRGRVGRGKHQSFCILEASKPNPKVDVMVETTDGFKIAEEDLNLRGAGDYLGKKQSGDNKFISQLIRFPTSHEKVKKTIGEILSDPSRVSKYSPLMEVGVKDGVFQYVGSKEEQDD